MDRPSPTNVPPAPTPCGRIRPSRSGPGGDHHEDTGVRRGMTATSTKPACATSSARSSGDRSGTPQRPWTTRANMRLRARRAVGVGVGRPGSPSRGATSRPAAEPRTRSPGSPSAGPGEEELAPERHVEGAVEPGRGRVGADHLEPVRHPEGGRTAPRLRRQVRCQLDPDGREGRERLKHTEDPAGHAAPELEMTVPVAHPAPHGVREPARPHRGDDPRRERVRRHRCRIRQTVRR